MGKQKIIPNYRSVTEDGDTWDFYAVSDAQAWYLALNNNDFDFISELFEIDADGNELRQVFTG